MNTQQDYWCWVDGDGNVTGFTSRQLDDTQVKKAHDDPKLLEFVQNGMGMG